VGSLNTNRKGGSWRLQVEHMLRGAGFITSARGLGFPGDDITATRHDLSLSIEAKNHNAIDLAGWVTQANANCPPDSIPIVVAHRRGHSSPMDGYVVMTGSALLSLLDKVLFTHDCNTGTADARP
jgi:hypothetical protein